MTFSDALERLKDGQKVTRSIYPEGTEITYHAHIDMRTVDGTIVPWLASQTDLLANDWAVVS